MERVVTITSQGQLTIPRSVRKRFGIAGSTKAALYTEGQYIIVEPKRDFWSLSGALRSPVRLSDTQLQRARKAFAHRWAKKI